MKNKINREEIEIKLCNSEDVHDIYKIQNIILKKMKKDIFYHLKKKVI